MKNHIRDIRMFLTVLVLCFISAAAVIRSQVYDTYEFDTVELKDQYQIAAKNYDVQGNRYTVKGEDSQIVYNIEDMGVKAFGIRIFFEKAPSFMQVYYADNPQGFSENETARISISDNDAAEVLFYEKNAFRIDIDEDFVLSRLELLVNRRVISASCMRYYIWAFLGSLALSVILIFIRPAKSVYYQIEQWLLSALRIFGENKRKIAVILIIFAALFVFAFLGEEAITLLSKDAVFSRNRLLLLYAGMMLVALAVILRKKTRTKPEVLFAVSALLVGSVMLMVMPNMSGVSWDDGIHYKRAAELSYGLKSQISYADQINGGVYSNIYGTVAGNYDEWNQTINQTAQNMDTLVEIEDEGLATNVYVAYIPSAIGLMLGRALNLNYTHIYFLGKWMNLLVYVLAFTAAARMLNRGKILLCAIGLIPTNLFLAVNYAYDWWVTCFTILGYAMFISELQKEDHEISFQKWIAILCVLVIGMLPKAIYFMLIFPLLFVGRKRFSKKIKPQWYWISVLGAMAILMTTFLLPMLLGSAGSGDARGGADVNSTGQIAFILHNPWQYSKILWDFLKDYVSLDNAGEYLINFAYLGMGRYFVLTFLVVVVSAFMEGKRREAGAGRVFKTMLVVAVLAAVVLVATALYISFTGVGYGTVSGCAPRYLLPLIFPLLYFIPESNVEMSQTNKSFSVSAVVLVLSGVMFSNLYSLCIAV